MKKNFYSRLVLYSFILLNFSCNRDLKLDKKIICQKTLNFHQIEKYYHTDVDPQRKPLIIKINDNISEPLHLTKFGETVIFLSEQDISKKNIKAYFEFIKIDILNNSATVKFKYTVEGLAGILYFRRNNDKWKIVNSDI
jgi:hypothetical protein